MTRVYRIPVYVIGTYTIMIDAAENMLRNVTDGLNIEVSGFS